MFFGFCFSTPFAHLGHFQSGVSPPWVENRADRSTGRAFGMHFGNLFPLQVWIDRRLVIQMPETEDKIKSR